jgi:hypothetical protein
MKILLGSFLVCLLAVDEAAPPKPPAALKLSAQPRAGYALVSIEAAQAPKEIRYIVTASGTSAEITFDQMGQNLIVTLPATGSVAVHAVALQADGTLVVPDSLELSAQKSPTPSGKLSITMVVRLANLSAPEKAVLESQALKQGLLSLGDSWLFADVNSPAFQQELAKAAALNPAVPKATETPFLFVRDAAGNFHSAYRLQLSTDTQNNINTILDLFRKK